MRVSAWLVLGLCLLRTPAFAGNEVDAAQGVIRAQEQALARDDCSSMIFPENRFALFRVMF